jgi:hypothetical protein
MKRTTRLRTLKNKLQKLRTLRSKLSKSRVREDGSIDFEACTKLNHTLTDISATKKKIGFLKHGKSYLGEPLGDQTPRVSNFD